MPACSVCFGKQLKVIKMIVAGKYRPTAGVRHAFSGDIDVKKRFKCANISVTYSFCRRHGIKTGHAEMRKTGGQRRRFRVAGQRRKCSQYRLDSHVMAV